MLNSSLIEILKAFSKHELKSFQDFVESPYHNKQSSVIKLYNQIKKFSPEFKSNRLIRDNLWKSIFPEKPYNYGIMKNLIYDLTKLAEEFISLLYREKDELRYSLNILKFLNERNKNKLAKKYFDKADKKIEQSKIKDADFYKSKFEIEKVRISMLFSKLSDEHRVKSIIEFERSTKYLIESFLISILEHYVMIANINKIHNYGIKTPLLDETLSFIKNNELYLENFYIKVYYYILLLEKEQDEKYYYELKTILSKLDNSFTTTFKYALWVNIDTYIAFRFHRGEESMGRELFELNKLSLEKTIYGKQDEEQFFMVSFITYFNVAVRLKEFAWAEEFVKKYYKKLNIKAQEDILNYCLAHLNTQKKNFLAANEYLSKVKKLHEPSMKLGLKMNMLIVYYELGWFESSINVTDAFKRLLDNEKNIHEVIKEKFRKFIKGYLMLLELNNKRDDNIELKFKRYLNETKGITSVNWLIRKAKDLGVEI